MGSRGPGIRWVRVLSAVVFDMQTVIAFVCINDLVVGLDEVQESFVPRRIGEVPMLVYVAGGE